MKEIDYIRAANHTKLEIAQRLLGDIMFYQPTSNLEEEHLRSAINSLNALLEASRKAAELSE